MSLVNKISKFKQDVDRFNKESKGKNYNFDYFTKNAPKKGEMSIKPYTEEDFIDEEILDEQEAEQTPTEIPQGGEAPAPADEGDAGALGDMVIPEPSAPAEVPAGTENATQPDTNETETKSEVPQTDVKSVQQGLKVEKMADKTDDIVSMVQSILDNVTNVQNSLENIPNIIDSKIENLKSELNTEKKGNSREFDSLSRNPFPYDMSLNDLYPNGKIEHSSEKMLSMKNINPNYSDQQIRDSLS
jgi:hypothetical protein